MHYKQILSSLSCKLNYNNGSGSVFYLFFLQKPDFCMRAMDIPYDRNMREDWYGKSGKPQGVIRLLWKDPDEENLLI